MTRRAKLLLRFGSAGLLFSVSLFAAFGILLWSDPEAAILALRGEPHAQVRSEPVTRAGRVHEASRLTTSGGLEFDLVVVRPSTEERTRLLILAVESEELLARTLELPESLPCAIALIGCQQEGAGPLESRRSADRATASFLAAWDGLSEAPWLDSSRIELAGQGALANSAGLALRYEGRLRAAWALAPSPPEPKGLREHLAYALAFEGGRSPDGELREARPGRFGPEVDRIAQEISSSPQVPGPDGLQPKAR